MRTTIRVCPACRRYTLKDACPDGHGASISPLPPRYSPEDRWGDYRRRLRKLEAP